jgi:dephospho-CoA kinase
MAVPFVGLTGGLGAGKSTALALLETLGAAVLSADAVVHELYCEDTVALAVAARFGDEVFAGEDVDRGALAARVFAHDEDRRWLEQLLWPLVARRTQEFHDQASSRVPPPRAAVFEAPLLFEADTQSRYAATIAVIADDSVRAERLGARPRGRTQLAQRDAHQLPQDEKARLATYVIVNNGSVAELREQLAAVLERLGR